MCYVRTPRAPYVPYALTFVEAAAGGRPMSTVLDTVFGPAFVRGREGEGVQAGSPQFKNYSFGGNEKENMAPPAAAFAWCGNVLAPFITRSSPASFPSTMTKGQMGSLQQRASAAMGVKNEAHAMQDVELRNETNVLLVPLIAGLQHKSVVNQLLALMSLSYAALSLVLIVLLSYPDRPCVDEDDRDCEATPRSVFHNLEFWGTFAFSVTEVIAIRYSPRNVSQARGLARPPSACVTAPHGPQNRTHRSTPTRTSSRS